MNSRYVKAVSIGFVLGLIAAATAAVFPQSLGWNIPFCDEFWEPIRTLPNSPQILALEHQAVALRFTHVLAENGFWFVSLPMLGAVGVAKLGQIRHKSILLEILHAAIWVALAITFVAAVLPLLPALFSMLQSLCSGVFTDPVELVLNYLRSMLFLVLLTWFSGFGLILEVSIVIAVVLANNEYSFRPDQRRSASVEPPSSHNYKSEAG